MTVMVEMPSALRQFADNQDELDSDGKNVEEVLADLCGRFPELKQNLYEMRAAFGISSIFTLMTKTSVMQMGCRPGSKMETGFRLSPPSREVISIQTVTA